MFNENYSDNPSVSVLVSTYGSLPLVHLQLEARRRLYPSLPCLVVDDASDVDLRGLCERYGASFLTSASRLGHQKGDIQALLSGLSWATFDAQGGQKSADILVKISRRWIWRRDFLPSLLDVVRSTQHTCFSNICRMYGFGFRSECFAVGVRAWQAERKALEDLLPLYPSGRLVEADVHNVARLVHDRHCCLRTEEHEMSFPRLYEVSSYAPWSALGESKLISTEWRLWYETESLSCYCRLALSWGLREYVPADFAPS